MRLAPQPRENPMGRIYDAAKNLADEYDLDLSRAGITGTGEDGAVTRDDVEEFLEEDADEEISDGPDLDEDEIREACEDLRGCSPPPEREDSGPDFGRIPRSIRGPGRGRPGLRCSGVREVRAGEGPPVR